MTRNPEVKINQMKGRISAKKDSCNRSAPEGKLTLNSEPSGDTLVVN
jgi:hypothetical protein